SVHVVGLGGGGLAPVGEVQVDHVPVAGGVGGGCVNIPLISVVDGGGVFARNDRMGGVGNGGKGRAGRAPRIGSWTLCSGIDDQAEVRRGGVGSVGRLQRERIGTQGCGRRHYGDLPAACRLGVQVRDGRTGGKPGHAEGDASCVSGASQGDGGAGAGTFGDGQRGGGELERVGCEGRDGRGAFSTAPANE